MKPKEIEYEMKTFLDKLAKKEAEVPPPKVKPAKIKTHNSKHPQYFEGEIQLRNINPEILSYVHKKIIEGRAFIAARIIHDEHNVDYKVSSKKIIRRLGQELRIRFGGEVSDSEQLFSRNHLTSKDVFRLNLIYRAPAQKIGDVISFEKRDLPYVITGFKESKAVLRHILTGKKTHIALKEISNVVEKIKTNVVSTKPFVTILDNDFQPVELIKPDDVELKEGQKIVCVEFLSKYYFVK